MRREPEAGQLVPVRDTQLYVVERGQGSPVIVLHGGPGLDHQTFGHYLDPLAGRWRLLFVDQRGQGRSGPAPAETWTLEEMARDVSGLAESLGLARYAVLGHSYGAFVALQHAVDDPGAAAATIVSAGIPSSSYLSHVETSLAAFDEPELRERLVISWARERVVRDAQDAADLLHDQWPFHFADPYDPRIAEYEAVTGGMVYSAEVLRHFANAEYGGIEVADRLAQVTQPVLVLAGRHDRSCSVDAAQAIARGVPDGLLVVFEQSGHMMFVEENAAYVAAVAAFLEDVL